MKNKPIYTYKQMKILHNSLAQLTRLFASQSGISALKQFAAETSSICPCLEKAKLRGREICIICGKEK